jgi:exopolysaccharide biosynthesis polyprenyl glycosylphosphotransferase
VVVDALIVATVIAAIWAPADRGRMPDFLLALLLVPFWITLLQYFGVYASHRLNGLGTMARKILSAHFVGLLALCFALWITRASLHLRSACIFALLCVAILITEKIAAHFALRLIRLRGFDLRNVLVIGSQERAGEIDSRFSEHLAWGLKVSCVGLGPTSERRYVAFRCSQPLGNSLEEVLKTQVVDEVLVAVPPEEIVNEQVTVHMCERYGVVARILLDNRSGHEKLETSEEFCGGLSIAVGPRRDAGLLLKRVVDAVGSLALMVLFAPMLLAVALIVKLSSPGPVIFKQTRVGLRGRKFTIYKFRTMVHGAEAFLPALASRTVMNGPIFKCFSDPRITEAGMILRKFSLDELPQLFNVLKGDMSLVGPRPLPVDESNAISGEYRRRFSMQPGLTCFWQVNGRSQTEFSKWMTYDLQYVDGWSLLMDAKLLLQTVYVVITGRGAY